MASRRLYSSCAEGAKRLFEYLMLCKNMLRVHEKLCGCTPILRFSLHFITRHWLLIILSMPVSNNTCHKVGRKADVAPNTHPFYIKQPTTKPQTR
eukprot:scaffold219237_cov23-Prasinocladus_malaysianus.AAC.1